ncbi:MAG: hypothetical protein IPG71_08070 [bacterium]|nr:hypothetical protein [bacterium]
MSSFLIGMSIGFIASIPAIVLAWFKAKRGMANFVKLWGLSVALRFTLIGIGLFWQLSQPEVGKVALVLGIVFAFYLSLAIEYLISRYAK